MNSPLLQNPKEMNLAKPPLVTLIGGFLGAGKTTAINALAQRFQQTGLKSAVITNDQAPNLVDTTIVRAAGQEVEEVSGGCFCCKLTGLLGASQRVVQWCGTVLPC